jgi:hypothetical protein
MRFLKRKNNVKNILFSTAIPYADDLLPAKMSIPQWYKDTEKPHPKNIIFSEDPKNIKYCRPFLDAFTTGYAMVTPFDIIVKRDNQTTFFSWADGNAAFIIPRGNNAAPLLPTPKGFSNEHFVWNTVHDIKLPKGYSALFVHPLNRHDLPFMTLSGVIDGELIHSGKIPFFIKDDFEGVIPAGTAYLQIIPFKIEGWVSKKDNTILDKARIQNLLSASFVYGWYIKYRWTKKRFD